MRNNYVTKTAGVDDDCDGNTDDGSGDNNLLAEDDNDVVKNEMIKL